MPPFRYFMPDYFQPLSCRLLSLLIFFALLLISFRYWLFFFHFHYTLFIDSLISLFDFLSLRYFRRFRHAALHAAAAGAFAAPLPRHYFHYFIIIFVFPLPRYYSLPAIAIIIITRLHPALALIAVIVTLSLPFRYAAMPFLFSRFHYYFHYYYCH
jgi:uncharacterized membrane protein